MTAYEYLMGLPRNMLPKDKSLGNVELSNSSIRRWLKNKSVIINGIKPDFNEEIKTPVEQLVFFPKGKRVTML